MRSFKYQKELRGGYKLLLKMGPKFRLPRYAQLSFGTNFTFLFIKRLTATLVQSLPPVISD